MILDFYHNKIVKDTLSEEFASSFSEILLPQLEARYGAELAGIQMYEDFISDNLVNSGYTYYPLTVILNRGFEIVWIRWSVENTADFKDGIPYSYIGSAPLGFDIVDTPPAAFMGVCEGRRMYFDGSVPPIYVNTVIDSVKLSGKYSQTFIDEMAYAVCREIEKSMGVSGIARTGIRLEIPFAPETYMEHTSENITYRRILISDKTSSAKDLWTKWTRLNSSVGYSVSDHVSGGDIVFELGEDVPQKVREKEYRFLTRVSAAKYQSAMGRRNVTEWRELIKRAIRRGELEKSSLPEEDAQISGQMNEELDRILEKIGYSAVVAQAPEPVEAVYDDELMRAIEIAEQTVMGDADGSEELSFMPDGVSLEVEGFGSDNQGESETEGELPFEEEDGGQEPESEDEVEHEAAPELEDELVSEDKLAADGDDEREILDELLLIDDMPSFDIDGLSQASEELDGQAPSAESAKNIYAEYEESRVSFERTAEERPKEDTGIEAQLRLKIEEEIEKRKDLENSLAVAIRECENIKTEFERLRSLYENAIAENKKETELHRIEKESLTSRIEGLLRSEEREKARLCEAALAEMEERRRQIAEAERVEAERYRLAQQRQKELEEERVFAEREAERERILKDSEKSQIVESEPYEVNYTTYSVRLVFRHSVDPNSVNKIGELIKTTVAYYKKENLKIHVRASIPESMTVRLDFTNIPDDEHELIVNIIKVLGNSDLGIAKAILD